MTKFEERLKNTFGGSVLRVVAEVGPLDAPAIYEVLEEREDGVVEGQITIDIGRIIPLNVVKVEEVSDTEWIVTDSEKRRYAWRAMREDRAKAFRKFITKYFN